MNTQVDYIISGRYVVAMDDAKTVVENGAVAVADGRIKEVGPLKKLSEKYQADTTIHEPWGLVMPGLVNVHTHAAMSCFRGLADDLPLMEWLTEHIFPREAKLTAEMVYASTLLSAAEMIRSGTTSFCDMYLFSQEVATAAEASGLRAWIGEPVYDFPSPTYGEADAAGDYIQSSFAAWQGHDRISITVAPHSTYTCSPERLQMLGDIAEQQNALFHIHLSETRSEVDEVTDRYGVSPPIHLDRLGLLNHRTVAAHCVMLTTDEQALFSRKCATVAHCPESNMKLASGIAPVPSMLQANITVGLGTDGSASNNDVDMFGEMDTCAKLHKVASLDPTAMPAGQVLECATRGGAQVLHAHQDIGSLEPGKKADLIMLDLDRPHLTPLYNVESHLVYAVRGTDVILSMVDGKLLMQDGKLTTIDEKLLTREMAGISKAIRSMC